ncbi:MAG TPA: GntP family permease [Sphingobacteriaceae bacterium]
MNLSFMYLLVCLFIGIAMIVVLTTKYKIHAFFALVLAAFVVGLSVQLPLNTVIATMKEGFGNIMKSLGMLIVIGTTLGILLEHTGSARVMASYILKNVGERHAPLSMSITGFIVGLPLFCDSGFIVLNGLNKSLARRTGISIGVMAVSLSSGLYAVHCLIPPHPGAAAAAGIMGVDPGKLIMAGIVVALPAMIAGYLWALYAGKKFTSIISRSEDVKKEENLNQPSVIKSFLPVVVPILLIASKAFITIDQDTTNGMLITLLSLGDPVIALSIGLLLAFNCKRSWQKDSLNHLLQESSEKAGNILVIIGAGGAFGAILAATKIGEHFSAELPLASLGILFPFLVTFILKTAQGSSTVAIITSASIILPLLPALGLANADGQLLCVLAMGAGSMMISHANDSYFWVIAKFSGIEMKPMLKVYSVATIWMGLTSLLMVYLLAQII